MRPAHSIRHGGRQSDLTVPYQYVSAHARGLRPRGVTAVLAFSHRSVLPSPSPEELGTPIWRFRGSIPDLCIPLSTLRSQNYSCQRMTRGQPVG